MKKKLVVLTGAGISAESGLKTFRDADGLWEGYNVMEVATPQAWERNPALVQQFYNERRKQVNAAQPNAAHIALAGLEEDFDVEIITQNIDDLHERAGSTKVSHLHGVITYAQSSRRANLIYPLQTDEIKMGELCELGSQLRPHVVWFGEAVPMIEKAAKEGKKTFTVTPEFGAPPYMVLHPQTGKPLVNQWEVNAWMMEAFKKRYL